MKKFYSLFATVIISVAAFAQTTITQWNFDASSISATTGTGTLAYIGGVTENTSTPYPQGNPTSGKSHSTINYPAQGTASGTAGVRFSVSTVGYSNISISLDLYGSNTASKYAQVQYTTDGSTWVNATASPSTIAGSWSTVTATMPAAANNNANFAVRVVSVFDPANGVTYSPIGTSSSYAIGGALRFDNVTVSSNSSLAVSDIKNVKGNFIKNTFVQDDEIVFGSQVKDVKIYNMFGQVVKTSAKDSTILNVAELTKGNYIVTGTVNNQPVSQKILKD
ncbi:T9SS type A sorting domain-containing protein [Chryseobacterium daecheongense]|uniref:Secreted protein (Por secretion system target) n=1 Tax=Chryseobacterium daecheongense TaxID=192389 RepID=A0A3N0W6P0_9FLAO|nr:T9SS type A sorting domain-containing protein [Chryseobacterium daecheongense]ROI00717.1 T9SS C-terminal target domain-containing protein [Chryseobacterium daecheongense]TDX94288.1 putative secreted protein (Por secretion system target) [Chryseobacterium daecheongense]